MEIKETEEIVTKAYVAETRRTKTTKHEVVCDICGKKACHPELVFMGHDSPNWRLDDNYKEETVVILHDEGTWYPEGGDRTTTSYDVCPDCFASHIVPLFKNPPKVVDVDW